jgi:CelD/BcsL family acetyltransferase involved in cellulose biosynthesis
MKVTLIPGRELSDDLVAIWAELQRKNPDLVSPFFHPEFTRIVASMRNDVQVAIVEDEGRIVAFFPFQRDSKKIGRAVGHPLSDYHGLICEPNLDFDPRTLLRACQLAAWYFDHLVVSQTPFQPYYWIRETSPIIHLTERFGDYVSAHKSHGSGLRIPRQLMRKLEREVGPLTFQSHVNDISVLNFIMRKKSEQYKRTNVPDLFASEWKRRTVEAVFNTQNTHFGGMLSVLSVNSDIVAALMGIRSSDVWHAWFLGFEDRFSSYSPGFLLYLRIVECGARLGFRYLDFGKGDQPYKKRLMTDSIPLAGGSVELPSWISFRRSMDRKLRGLVRASPMAGPITQVRRLVRLHLHT